jgi:hypothetical protein
VTPLTKRQVIDGPSCLTRAAEDEPVFVLRAKDPAAPAAMRAWAKFSSENELHEPEKIAQAYQEAHQFEEWRRTNYKVKP